MVKRKFFVSRPDSGVVRHRQAVYAQEEAKPAAAPKRKKLNYQERLALEGKHMVQFVVPAGLWTRFLVLRCDNGRPGVPNRVFTAWLEAQTREIPGADVCDDSAKFVALPGV